MGVTVFLNFAMKLESGSSIEKLRALCGLLGVRGRGVPGLLVAHACAAGAEGGFGALGAVGGSGAAEALVHGDWRHPSSGLLHL